MGVDAALPLNADPKLGVRSPGGAAATRRRRRSVGPVELGVGVRADLDDGVEGSVDSGLEAACVELLPFLTARLDVLLQLLAALDHLLGDPVQVLIGGEVSGQQAAADRKSVV